MFRWATKGCRIADGSVVRLEAARVGGRWLTSSEALARFAAALSALPADNDTPRSPAGQRRAASAVDRELDRLGF